MIVKDSNFHKLDETEKLMIGYLFEDAYVFDKKKKKETYVGSFYGDPTCGVIDQHNSWCIFGGVSLILWKSNGEIINVREDEPDNWIYKIRQTDTYEVEFLIESNSENYSLWKLNIQTLKMIKMKDLEKR